MSSKQNKKAMYKQEEISQYASSGQKPNKCL